MSSGLNLKIHPALDIGLKVPFTAGLCPQPVRSLAAMFLENIRLKLRYIGWPYLRLWLLLHGGLIAAGALLVWQWPLVDLSDSLGVFFGTILLAFLAISWGLKRAFTFIKQPIKKPGAWVFLVFFYTFLTFTFAISTVPRYVAAQFGRQQRLSRLAYLPQFPPARYYRAGTALLDTLHQVASATTYMSGGKSSHRYFQLAIVCPAVSHLPASPIGTAPVWVGFYYRADTSAIQFINDYWPAYQHFIAQRKLLFQREFERPCYYFERQSSGQIALALQEALPVAADSAVVLRPVYTPFGKRASGIITVWLWSQSVGNGLLLVTLLALPLDPLRRQQLLATKPVLFPPIS